MDQERLLVYIRAMILLENNLFFKRLIVAAVRLRRIPSLLAAIACAVLLAVPTAHADGLGGADGSGPLPGVGGAPDSAPAALTGTLEKSLPPAAATGQRGTQFRSNLIDSKSLQAGPTFDYRPNTVNPEVPLVASRRDDFDPVEVGGFVGYLFHDQASGLPTSSLGFDLQVATDSKGTQSGWLVQPGVDYSTALAPSLQFNTRLFSTYSPDGSNVSALGLDRPSSLRPGEPGFQDVGVGLGLGYSITDSWNIQTQARYQRMLGAGETASQSETSPNQFFGGVMVDYKF